VQRSIGIAAGVLLLLVPLVPNARAGAGAPGSMSIPVSLADLAAAAGLQRADPSTLPLDIVRLAFASPEGSKNQPPPRRTAILRILEGGGDSGDRIPLPLDPRIWRTHILSAEVADDRLAGAILGRRPTALLYLGLAALDPETLAWIEAHAGVLEALQTHPGATAAFARSIHIRDGAVVTPGDDSKGVWKAIVDADPGDPASFIAKLLAARDGRIAAFYDAVAHLDAAHRRFALGAPGDPQRLDRARRLVEAVTRDSLPWGLEDYPFLRPDVDASIILRRVALDERGVPLGPSGSTWAKVFGGVSDADGPVDADWLAAAVLKGSGGVSRRRLDTLLFAQRALSSDTNAERATVVAALQGFQRYPALMLTLEANGVRTAAVYAAAARAAAAIGRDDEAIAVFQSGLAIVDRARQSGTLRAVEARKLIASLTDAAASRPRRAALLSWLKGALLPALHQALEAGRAEVQAAQPEDAAETLVLRALAGPTPVRPALVEWEGRRYSVDLAQPELRRLTLIRKGQRETSLDAALASATPRNMSALSYSLAGLVYAAAIGEPDSQASSGGAVWRRHRFGGVRQNPGESLVAWRIATEVFGAGEWHLTGSLLRLDLALAHLALRRLDPTEMPAASLLSTMDRRTLARTVALMDPRAISDEARDALVTALARGRERVASLVAHPEALDAVAEQAALSEWRLSAIRWLLTHDATRVPGAFTTLELFRLGGGSPAPVWGAAAGPLDGCFCLRMPDATAWEEYTGRASTGQLGTQLADVTLRTAEALAARHLPSLLTRDVAAFAMQDVLDLARPAYFDDWLSVAFAARDLKDDRFDDYVAALTAAGPLVPLKNPPR
jgi:hypothetical protein